MNCSSLRPIVIDGSNVAFAHGSLTPNVKKFSSKGIEMCIDYFVKKGHKEVIAVLPQKYLKPDSGVENMEILQSLKEKGFLRLTPSGSFSTGAHFMSYDDRYAMMRY